MAQSYWWYMKAILRACNTLLLHLLLPVSKVQIHIPYRKGHSKSQQEAEPDEEVGFDRTALIISAYRDSTPDGHHNN